MSDKLTEAQMDRVIEDAAKEVGVTILEACDETADDKQRFVMVCQIAAHVFGMAGAYFQRMPGREKSDRYEATAAVLEHISELAVPPRS